MKSLSSDLLRSNERIENLSAPKGFRNQFFVRRAVKDIAIYRDCQNSDWEDNYEPRLFHARSGRLAPAEGALRISVRSYRLIGREGVNCLGSNFAVRCLRARFRNLLTRESQPRNVKLDGVMHLTFNLCASAPGRDAAW